VELVRKSRKVYHLSLSRKGRLLKRRLKGGSLLGKGLTAGDRIISKVLDYFTLQRESACHWCGRGGRSESGGGERGGGALEGRFREKKRPRAFGRVSASEKEEG